MKLYACTILYVSDILPSCGVWRGASNAETDDGTRVRSYAIHPVRILSYIFLHFDLYNRIYARRFPPTWPVFTPAPKVCPITILFHEFRLIFYWFSWQTGSKDTPNSWNSISGPHLPSQLSHKIPPPRFGLSLSGAATKMELRRKKGRSRSDILSLH